MKLIVSLLAVASAQFKPKPCCVTYKIDDTREIQLEGLNYSGTYYKKFGSKDGRIYQLKSVEADVYLYWTMEGIQVINFITGWIEKIRIFKPSKKTKRGG